MVNLNAEQRLSEAPQVEKPGSTLPRSHGWTSSANCGKLNCYYMDDILPGDIVNLRSSFFARMTTPFYPVYGDLFIDQYFFFVPCRLTWTHWKEFMGEVNDSAWVTSTTYRVPCIKASSSVRSVNDLPHQCGVSPRIPDTAAVGGWSSYGYIISLPYRAIRLIKNDWFRNQNLEAPLLINFGDSDDTDYTLFQQPDVTRVKDLFGTCLPGTQKSSDPVTVALSGYANVYPSKDGNKTLPVSDPLFNSKVSNGGILWNTNTGTTISTPSYITTKAAVNNGNSGTMPIGSTPGGSYPIPFNLVVGDGFGANHFGIDVNELRSSIALQRTLERMAYSGSRYIETIRAFFGIVSPDARQQRPELLAHRRTHVRMSDVTQSSPQVVGQTMTPLGTVGAYSKTADNQLAFSKSFTEHGFLIGLFCIRHARSYSQGIPAMQMRKTFGDYYLPTFAHIGEQPVRKWRIYAEDLNGNDIFGYNEAWSDGYRYFESINTGLLDPGAQLDANGDPAGLGAVWTYGDYYKLSPTLSSSWIHEGDSEVVRTLAVQNEDQFTVDVWFDVDHTRVMPVHSVPGLMDHF